MKKIKTYKFKLVPNKEQEATLAHNLDVTRLILRTNCDIERRGM
jgi:transposase